MALLIIITVASYWGFGQVKQQFFPNSNTPLFFAHYKLEQGTPIDVTMVMSAAQCGPQSFYVENNLFYICPDMCAQIEADPSPQLNTVEVVCPDP